MNLITSGHKGLRPLVGNLTGLILVLDHTRLNRRYQLPRFQIVKAIGGFGCKEGAMGTAVFGMCLADNEEARWRRHDFIGIASDNLVQEAIADTTPVTDINLNDRHYLLLAKDLTVASGDTPHQAMTRLRRRTKAAVLFAYHCHPESAFNDAGFLTYPKGATPVEVQLKKRGGFWTDAS